MNFKHFMPTEVYFGKHVLSTNRKLLKTFGQRAMIVTGKSSAKKCGALDDLSSALSGVDIEFIIFDEVEENPSLETIEKGSSIGKDFGADFVIGVGGGSPMDAAKAMAVFIKNPEITAENIFDGRVLGHIPMLAIPTTSGTGSEVTQYSIVTSNKEKTKKGLGQIVFPSIAFVDSRYTECLPYDVTVSTAIDAFTHLVEGYLNTNSSLMSEMYGEKGFELFKGCFKKLIDKNLDGEFRENVMLASTLGGIQIALAGTSLPHGMGYPLTYYKGLPHGIANGILTIGYLKSFKNKSRISRALKLLGLSDISELEDIFKHLFTININITDEEIFAYAEAFMDQKDKLKNHTEPVTMQDIIDIYTVSLAK